MTTTTAVASPFIEARWPARAARQPAVDPRDLLIHDIRTPLAAIRVYAQLSLRRSVPRKSDMDDLAECLRGIDEAATRVGHLLDELSSVPTDSGADGTDHQRKMIDLVDLVKRIAVESKAAALGRSRVVVLSAVPRLVGSWDSARVQSVLANLIDNALKYNRHDRPVVVSIGHVRGWAIVSATDQGVGIRAGELAHVFEPGYRASNVISHFGGSGRAARVHGQARPTGSSLPAQSPPRAS